MYITVLLIGECRGDVSLHMRVDIIAHVYGEQMSCILRCLDPTLWGISISRYMPIHLAQVPFHTFRMENMFVL